MTIEDVVDFVEKHQGNWLPTIGGQAVFSPKNVRGTAFEFTIASGKIRQENRDWVGKSLKIFNATGSLKITDYAQTKTQNASYVLGLFWQIASQSNGSQTPDKDLPIEEKEINAATPTDQTELKKSRLGQGLFRSRLLRLRRKCYVTGVSKDAFLRASHIKPWKDSNNLERLDKFNGLLLTPNYDALLDAGYISFEDDGKILISPKLPQDIIDALNINVHFQGLDLGAETKLYLAYHRREIFTT